MDKVTRPLVRYHGGKWRLAPWIISHFPKHRVYVEPYGGAGSVLLRKPRSYAEVYNDLDGEIVNLFRVVRENGHELCRLLESTPFSRVEFEESYFPTSDPIEQARRTVVRSYMGFGSSSSTKDKSQKGGLPATGFRANSNRSSTTPAHDWMNYPTALRKIIQRLRGVVIENRDAIDVIRQHDSFDTLFYLDPPYLPETRDSGTDYRHEMTKDQHVNLAEVLLAIRGTAIVSGYPSALYDEMFTRWHRVEKSTFADGARPRIEVLWINRRDLSELNFED